MENKKHSEFLQACTDKLVLASRIHQDRSPYITLEQNKFLFGEIAAHYESSFAHADTLHSLGFAHADLLSVIYRMFDCSLQDVVLHRPTFIWDKRDVLIAVGEYFKDFSRDTLHKKLHTLCCAAKIETEDFKMREESTVLNRFNQILDVANLFELDWMAGYGRYISPIEQDMCRYWYSLPSDILNTLATHIVDAFFHGFISQSRDRAKRTNIRFRYAIGQEALAQQVVSIFLTRGLEPIIVQPSSIAYSRQYTSDSQYDFAVYNDACYYKAQAIAYEVALNNYRENIENICGFVRIGTFGNDLSFVLRGRYAYKPRAQVMKMYNSMRANKRNAESAMLKPDTISFCSVVFPDMRLGDTFRAVFDAFYKLNTEKSKEYEVIQSHLIDILDECDHVKLQGMNGNMTDLTVSMVELEFPSVQTKFLNCGGDLNIPHGELFTTPVLAGTNGILHVKEIFLCDKYYKNIRLVFSEGRIIDYTCDNFKDSKKNKQYVFENLLNSTKNMPMGELSIGTNTLAYRIAMDFNLFSCLPILVAEKMGPHIAVGDPCFAHAEDSPVYNIYGGKEMIARDNVITKTRTQNPQCYVNSHTDITIPFYEMGLFAGINTKTGEMHKIIENARFIPTVAQKLNENLE